ncbi:hypothetical protein NOVO_09035 [Rickettsiales bacterium Ac37b]|nr:hypothetical protein NOVO_09035 [Rickettsiales bacterium Ac37b]
MEHCCDNMRYYVKENKEINYDPSLRSYDMRVSEDRRGTSQELYYCPWCGIKLPKELNTEWFKALREEYGIKDPIFDDADKVPPEFHTDEWWKKRGL